MPPGLLIGAPERDELAGFMATSAHGAGPENQKKSLQRSRIFFGSRLISMNVHLPLPM